MVSLYYIQWDLKMKFEHQCVFDADIEKYVFTWL